MQIVIDIDENLYTRLFDNAQVDAVDMLKACSVIRKGTLLPKEHGRLIDADKLHHCEYKGNFSKCEGCMNSYWCDLIDNTQTIIEAESEE